MTQPFRLDHGGAVDRGTPIRVSFDGRELGGFVGDTVASILMANGVRVCSRGLYSGRPRGLMSAGPEEANCFVQVVSGAGEPMVRATELEAYHGLVVESLVGKGKLHDLPDTSRYDKTFVQVETLVVGGGRSGARAAAEAARDGDRVLLVQDRPSLGGGVDRHALTEAGVVVLTRTTATGLHEHGYVVAVERRTDHLSTPPAGMSRHRLWNIRARRIVLATGAHERPIAFTGNDVPGVMLAASAARYVTDYAVAPGRVAVLFGCHDGIAESARILAGAGVRLAGVVDTRPAAEPGLRESLADTGIPVRIGSVVSTRASDDGVLEAVVVTSHDGSTQTIDCDLLAVSGGWNPALQLFTHTGGTTRWSDGAAAFVPGQGPPHVVVTGQATGAFAADLHPRATFCIDAAETDPASVYLDLQRDATLADLRRAVSAGMRSVEHVKRYTTISTAADQGRSSGVLTVGVLCQELGVPMSEGVTSTYRPPYTPIPFALLAGRDRGMLADPERVSPIHDWHVAQGAVFEDVGQWKRPWYFPAFAGESMHDAVARECASARASVAMMDASTLGKIELHGADVGAFLDRIYTNMMSTLAVGKVRYGVMCSADGMVLDDGTVAHLSADRWILTTTTGNAAKVLDWLEEWLQTEWPDLDVRCCSVTEHWATIAVVGPRSRDVVSAVAPDLDVSNEGFGFMDWRDTVIGGCRARVMRISFSGELAYEVNVDGWHGQAMWEVVYEAGQKYGVTPYGTETMHVLRAEKGYPIVGQDTDGTVTPFDLGMSWIVSKKKPDFVGKRSYARTDAMRAGRKQLVGLVPVDGRSPLTEGAQLVAATADLGDLPVPMLGHVTSAYDSVALGTPFALALLADGAARHGDELQAVDELVGTPVRVTSPVQYDPEGARRDGA
ncbi:MAG: (2Fe-2S)-binding protein [Propionibacteriales bacterium]|nr:(2Fe-2S)-binding protein [Propionibacteriales bacterium]